MGVRRRESHGIGTHPAHSRAPAKVSTAGGKSLRRKNGSQLLGRRSALNVGSLRLHSPPGKEKRGIHTRVDPEGSRSTLRFSFPGDYAAPDSQHSEVSTSPESASRYFLPSDFPPSGSTPWPPQPLGRCSPVREGVQSW
jgi:hypothetical protein